uniref:Mannosyltransferase n=1 Tax=Heterorhabditis bacteriophora TaxID=37862 RepID=A0A1I7XME1_HETBA
MDFALAIVDTVRSVRQQMQLPTSMTFQGKLLPYEFIFTFSDISLYNVTINYFRIIVVSQFHFMFYASRTLPNTFALIIVLVVYQRCLDNRYESAVRWATVAAVLFRCELIILFAPLFASALLSGCLPILGWNGAIFIGLKTALKVLVITVPIDSFFWGRILYPEGEVAIFNLLLNKSHEYGVSPFFWYFYSCFPRAFMASFPLIIIGCFLDRRLKNIIFPAVIFVFIYSFLPHKELRFIIYIIPILDLSAAVVCSRMYISRKKSWIRQFIYLGCVLHIIANFLGTSVFLYAGSRNYPGGDALGHLQVKYYL